MNLSETHLDIPRLPREAKLEGVPKSAKDSVFSETGLADALDLANRTFGLGSKQRRAELDVLLPKDREGLENIFMGLGSIASNSVNPTSPRAIHSNYLSTVLAERIAKISVPAESETELAKESRTGLPGFMRYSGDTYRRIEDYLDPENYDPHASILNMHKDKAVDWRVKNVVGDDDPSSPEIAILSAELFRRYNSTNEPLDMILKKYAAFCLEVDRIKVQAYGQQAPTVAANQLISGYASLIADQVGYSPELIDLIRTTDKGLIGVDDQNWLRIKLEGLELKLNHQGMLNLYLRRYNRFVGKMINMGYNQKDTERNRQIADETMPLLVELRRYGIKPAFFSDGILTKRPDESWVITDPSEISEVDRCPARPEMAAFHLAATDRPTDLGYVATKSDRGSLTISPNFDINLMLGLRADGELVISSGMLSTISLRPTFETQGLAALYEILRVELSGYLFDLVAPTSLAIDRHNKVGRISRLINGVREASNVGDLLLARVRYVKDNMPQTIDSLELEQHKGRKVIVGHDVVGHVRDLPKGYRPSETAINRALEHGIILGPNQTFVKKHHRGSDDIGKVTSHRASIRYPSD